MSIAESGRKLTPQDLLALPDQARFELVDGELVERNVSVLSTLVELFVAAKLFEYCQMHSLGHVWPGTNGIRCFPDDPDKVRRPDACFVRRERFEPRIWEEGYLSISPDLVVEVLSPGDLAYDVDKKIEEYLNAGIPLIWIVDPEARLVYVHRKDGTITKLRETNELDGEDVLPGFRVTVSQLFPPKRDAASPS